MIRLVSRALLARHRQARNPPKPVEPEVYADGTNEWISGVNSDIGEKKKKENEKEEGGEVDEYSDEKEEQAEATYAEDE